MTLTRNDIVGHRIIAVLQTPFTEPKPIVDGLGLASFCAVVFMLGNGRRLATYFDDLSEYDLEEEPLEIVTVHGRTDREFLGHTITEVIISDANQIYFVLSNGIVIADYCIDDVHGNWFIVADPGDVTRKYDDGLFQTFWERKPWHWKTVSRTDT